MTGKKMESRLTIGTKVRLGQNISGFHEKLESKLSVGTKIRLGEKFVEQSGYKGWKSGDVITLVEGYFEWDNGLYTVEETAPSIWDDKRKEFSSIYHMFGNNLEDFMDCEIVKQ